MLFFSSPVLFSVPSGELDLAFFDRSWPRGMLASALFLSFKIKKDASQAKSDLRQIGLRIRALRGDMRQEELASQLGVSQGQLPKVERGKVPPALEILLGVATTFGKTLDWIVRGDGS